jgi:hypothetical protein
MGGRRWFLILLGAVVLSGCGGTQQARPFATVAASPLPSAQMSEWLSFDAANKTATFTIVANVPGTKSEFNYNGYTNGALVITVPKGWTVTVHCNDDPAATYAHSCTVVSGADSRTPAFPGASLPGNRLRHRGRKEDLQLHAGRGVCRPVRLPADRP